MNTKRLLWDLLLFQVVALILFLVLFFGPGCGTGSGNPERDVWPLSEASTDPASEYLQSPLMFEPNFQECGSHVGQTTDAEIDIGRACIREAFANCHPARYLLADLNSDGQRFVSFVSVYVTTTSPLACELRVHTVSEDPSRFVGDEAKTCTTLAPDEPIELACGIQG